VTTHVDLAFFVLLAVLFPLWAALFGLRRLRRASLEDLPQARLWLYRRAIVIQWALTFAVLTHWIRQRRTWDELGLGLHVTPGLIGVLVGLAIVSVLILRQRTAAMRDDEALASVRRQLTRLERMLPRSRRELSWFYGLSVTAGLCEEFLYRGYMIWFLTHWMGLIPAVGAGALLFGLAHAYQGPRGMAMTGAVGVFLGALYLVSGSIWLGMIAHALMDAHSGHLGYVALTREPIEVPASDDEGFELVPEDAVELPADIGPERSLAEHADVAMEPPPNSMTEPRS
jgi:uncharacterized protein